MRFQRCALSFPTCGCKTHLRGQKYQSCGAKMTCADTSFTGAASKLTCTALISSVRQEFYHWNFSKCNMYVRIINVQTGTHTSEIKWSPAPFSGVYVASKFALRGEYRSSLPCRLYGWQFFKYHGRNVRYIGRGNSTFYGGLFAQKIIPHTHSEI